MFSFSQVEARGGDASDREAVLRGVLHAGPEVRVDPQHLRGAVDRAGDHLLSHKEDGRVARTEDGRGRALGGIPVRRPRHQGTAEGAQVVQGREREGEAPFFFCPNNLLHV